MDCSDNLRRESSGGRRHFLCSTASIGSLALTGCSAIHSASDEDESGGGDGSDDSRSDGSDDVRFQAVFEKLPLTAYDYNPFADLRPDSSHGLFAQWTQYLVSADRFHPHLVESWEHDEGELTLALADVFRWSSTGDPITAEDLAFQLDVYATADHPATRFVDVVTAIGEFELAISYPADLNPDLVEYSLLPLLADVPPSSWEGLDWEDDPAALEIMSPDASGPLALTDLRRDVAQLTVRDGVDEIADHPLAEHYNWSGYDVRSRSSEVGAHQLLIAGDVDGTSDLFTTPETREQFPETTREITFPAGTGVGLWFDHESELWTHQNTRQAFLHAVDRPAVLEAVGASTGILHSVPTGLSAATHSNWSLPADESSFLTYDGGLQRARSLLSDIGYEPAELDLTIAFPEQETSMGLVARAIEDQFEETDWSVTAGATSGDPGDVLARDGVDLLAYRTGPEPRVQRYHPYFAFEFLLEGDHNADEHFAGYDVETVSVDDTEIDVPAALADLRTTAPRDEQRPIVERLALAINRDLPCAFLFEDRVQLFIDTERFAIPDSSDHMHSYWPQWWLPKVDETLPGYDTPGLLKYKAD